MRNKNSLIQHFNPVCRLARDYPHLPIARLLMSLNDFDLPALHSFTCDGYGKFSTPFAVTLSPNIGNNNLYTTI